MSLIGSVEVRLKQLLKDYSLRVTQGRLDVMAIFMKKNVAVSQADIEAMTDGKYDRVTIYRTLKSFLECGLIHKVPGDASSTRYALCAEGYHHHVHFQCAHCDETTCLEDVHIPAVELPEGFLPKESNFLVKGICNRCS